MVKNNPSKRKNKNNKFSPKLILLVFFLSFLFVIFCWFLNYYKNNFLSKNYVINSHIKSIVDSDENIYNKKSVIKKISVIKNVENSVINYEQKDKEYLDKIINKN
jgi:hypothetical protein